MPSNMSLIVNIELNGSQNARGTDWTLQESYSQGVTIPPSSNVVDQHGNITLANMARTPAFGNATEITFVITRVNVTDRNNRPAIVGFVTPRADAIRFVPPRGNEFSDFAGEGNNLVLSFLDADDNAMTYEYHLRVVCLEVGGMNPIMKELDPRIVNRP
jgi:hypothetical protein